MQMLSNLYKTWSEDDKKIFRKWLKDHLKYGPLTVTFLKKDGSERKMLCTLKTEDVPSYEKKTERVKAVNEETCSVFDIEKQEWRSFRFDSVTQIDFDIK